MKPRVPSEAQSTSQNEGESWLSPRVMAPHVSLWQEPCSVATHVQSIPCRCFEKEKKKGTVQWRNERNLVIYLNPPGPCCSQRSEMVGIACPGCRQPQDPCLRFPPSRVSYWCPAFVKGRDREVKPRLVTSFGVGVRVRHCPGTPQAQRPRFVPSCLSKFKLSQGSSRATLGNFAAGPGTPNTHS